MIKIFIKQVQKQTNKRSQNHSFWIQINIEKLSHFCLLNFHSYFCLFENDDNTGGNYWEWICNENNSQAKFITIWMTISDWLPHNLEIYWLQLPIWNSLAMYDIESQSLINNFTEECHSLQIQSNEEVWCLITTPRTPSIKIFLNNGSKDSSTKSVSASINPGPLCFKYHLWMDCINIWYTNFVLYIENEQIYALNTETYE